MLSFLLPCGDYALQVSLVFFYFMVPGLRCKFHGFKLKIHREQIGHGLIFPLSLLEMFRSTSPLEPLIQIHTQPDSAHKSRPQKGRFDLGYGLLPNFQLLEEDEDV